MFLSAIPPALSEMVMTVLPPSENAQMEIRASTTLCSTSASRAFDRRFRSTWAYSLGYGQPDEPDWWKGKGEVSVLLLDLENKPPSDNKTQRHTIGEHNARHDCTDPATWASSICFGEHAEKLAGCVKGDSDSVSGKLTAGI